MYMSCHSNFSLILSSDYLKRNNSHCDIGRKTGLSNAFIILAVVTLTTSNIVFNTSKMHTIMI